MDADRERSFALEEIKPFIVGIEYAIFRTIWRFQQKCLGRCVGLHSAVVVQMLLSEIGNGGYFLGASPPTGAPSAAFGSGTGLSASVRR